MESGVRCVVEIGVEVSPKLGNGKLARSLRKESEDHGVDGSGRGSEENAMCGYEVGNDGAAFAPLLLGFEMYYAIYMGCC